MMSQLSVLAVCALLTALIQLSGFAVAYALQTEKFYDILGGINFLVLAACSAILGSSDESDDNDGLQQQSSWSNDQRKVSCTIIFCISRSWLLLYLAWRAHERNGDSRFDNVKDKFGTFLLYWIVQGIWVFAISMPVMFVNSSNDVRNPNFDTRDYLTLIGFASGVTLEIVADVQKACWVKAGRPGHFCQCGIWKLSRHPNYFGEMLQWWCAFGYAYGSSSTGVKDILWWCTIVSPLVTMQILLNTGGTGVAHANGKKLKRYYDACPNEYAKYRESTSILIPMVGYKYVPLFLKRTIFMDFERYEYKPKDDAKSD